MPFKIVRNDITEMKTEAIVNTANSRPMVGTGCDSAVYRAAGYDQLLAYRKEKIGFVPEGEAFITPGFNLYAKYIIHAVSPLFMGGDRGEEEKLRACYRKSLQIAKEHQIRSVAFPLISTGGFGYPKEEGLRIAADEINAFLSGNEMEIFLVVFDDRTTKLGSRLYPGLEEYIDRNYVAEKQRKEYGIRREADSPNLNAAMAGSVPEAPLLSASRPSAPHPAAPRPAASRPAASPPAASRPAAPEKPSSRKKPFFGSIFKKEEKKEERKITAPYPDDLAEGSFFTEEEESSYVDFEEQHESRLEERMQHISDTFSQYLMYLIRDRKMENADVYKRAVVDKKIFSKIKNNVNYHPQKLTALCLCVGARLSLDETKDLLARAGYALSPCDKTDIIFSYFIENGIYDMIELDIQLEEHGLPCIIT